jgi:hypothetical protein
MSMGMSSRASAKGLGGSTGTTDGYLKDGGPEDGWMGGLGLGGLGMVNRTVRSTREM